MWLLWITASQPVPPLPAPRLASEDDDNPGMRGGAGEFEGYERATAGMERIAVPEPVPWWVSGRVVDLDTGVPLGGWNVVVTQIGKGELLAKTSANGRFEIQLGLPGILSVEAYSGSDGSSAAPFEWPLPLGADQLAARIPERRAGNSVVIACRELWSEGTISWTLAGGVGHVELADLRVLQGPRSGR